MPHSTMTRKGQTTIPAKFRRLWKSSEVVWEETPDGGALVRPVPDIMELFGSAHTAAHRDPSEKNKARSAWGEEVAEEGR